MRGKFVVGLAVLSMLAACQTPAERQAEADKLAAEIAAKRGEEVRQICFTRNINGWRELGNDALLLRKGVKDWYMVELSGACQPSWAFNAISVRSRPASSSCLSRGDVIKTDDPLDGSCIIKRIYEWNEDAEVKGDKDSE